MTNAREMLRFRNELHTRLSHDELRDIGWPKLLDATANAVARGWTGQELAAWCDAALAGNPPHSVGAVLVTTVRELAAQDPPRDATPTPPPIDHQALRQAHAAAAGVDHGAWAARIRKSA